MIPIDLLAVVFFVSGALLIGIWIDAAQNSFLRAHARRPTAGSFTGDEVVRLTGTPQRDPGLERLRQRYLPRRGIGLAVIAASWVVWLGTRLEVSAPTPRCGAMIRDLAETRTQPHAVAVSEPGMV